MTGRIPLDHLTSDQYDALCARADQLARILHVVLSEFRPLPGTSIATACIDTDTLQRWHTALDQEQPRV